jgi:tetratricopeptide (TPR) repeat protein
MAEGGWVNPLETARIAGDVILRLGFCARGRIEEGIEELKQRMQRGDRAVPSLPDLLLERNQLLREHYEYVLRQMPSKEKEGLSAAKLGIIVLVVLAVGGTCLALWPVDPAAQRARALKYCAEGKRLLGEGKAAEAVDAFASAVKADGSLPEAWRGRGEALLARGDAAAAVRDFDQAVSLSAKDAAAWRGRSRAQLALGERAKAVADATCAIELAPGESEGYLVRGEALEARNDLQEAIEDFTKAVHLDPAALDPYLPLARSLKGAGKFDEAIAALVQLLKRAPASWPQRKEAETLLSQMR